MSTVFVRGVAWFDRALDAAIKAGIAEALTDLALAYREGVRLLRYDDPMGFDRVRVERDGLAVVISADNVVIGFVNDPAQLRAGRASPGPTRSKGAKRGPRDLAELKTWLRDSGYIVAQTKQHSGVFDLKGNRVATLPNSPSDARALANLVSDIRKTTGLELRR